MVVAIDLCDFGTCAERGLVIDSVGDAEEEGGVAENLCAQLSVSFEWRARAELGPVDS